MKNTNLIIMILIGVIALGAGFFGGMQYQKSQVPSFQFGNGVNGQNFRQGMMNGGSQQNNQTGRMMGRGNGAVRGEIINADDKTITVKLTDGSTKLVLIGSGSTVSQSVTATVKDLTVGKQVAVFGTANTDGSVTAQTLELNPRVQPIKQ